MPAVRWLHRAIAELGVHTLYASSIDTKLIILLRFIRLFAYGSTTLIFALYLSALHYSPASIGLLMSLGLAGDLFSFFLVLIADGFGRRRTLAAGAALMCISGLVFASSGNYWVLLVAAVMGIISPSGKEIGPFRAIEESTLAQLTEVERRSDVYAWYKLGGTAGEACGTVVCGLVVQLLQAGGSGIGWNEIESYRVVFCVYAGLGVFNLILACCLSHAVEVEQGARHLPRKDGIDGESETSPLLVDAEPDQCNEMISDQKEQQKRSLMPTISRESRPVVARLCILFAIDSFASGLVPSSLVTFFFYLKFHLPPASLGTIFSVAALISALSALAASALTKRIGPVRTMVFTHLPSAVFLALIPLPPILAPAVLFLLLRACTKSMDDVPRSAFLAAIVTPEERTVVIGLVGVLKMLAQSAGPWLTGILAENEMFWVSFVLAGIVKIGYDLCFYRMFRGHQVRNASHVNG